jgi:acetyl esterase/lipase
MIGFGDATAIDVDRGVPFATPGERSLRLDLYRPGTREPTQATPSAARRAAVVLASGRDWQAPDRDDLARYALDLAERGYVCVVPEYRGSDTAAFPAQIRDLKASIRWLRASAAELGVDPARIGVFGHAAGAHLAVLAALTPDDASLAPAPTAFGGVDTPSDPATASDALTAVVGVAGTYALEQQPETDALVSLLGGDREAEPDAWTRASPSTYLGSGGPPTAPGDDGDRAQSGDTTGDTDADGGQSADPGDDRPPILLLHGGDDAVVPPMASELFYDLLEAHDVPAECVVAADAGHDVHVTQRAFVLQWTSGFLDRHLR